MSICIHELPLSGIRFRSRTHQLVAKAKLLRQPKTPQSVRPGGLDRTGGPRLLAVERRRAGGRAHCGTTMPFVAVTHDCRMPDL